MDFRANITPIEVIEKGAFGGTYFKDIYSSVTDKWYKNSWKKFDVLKNIDQKYYCSNYHDASINKYGVKCGTSLRFWENKRWIYSIDPYACFQWYFRYWLGRRSIDDKRQIARWKGIVTRFKSELVKMIEDANSRFNEYSFSLKIRQTLLHWGYQLTESDSLLFIFLFFCQYKNELLLVQ